MGESAQRSPTYFDSEFRLNVPVRGPFRRYTPRPLGFRSTATVAPASTASSNPTKPFRVVHLTDLHIQPEKGATDGVTKALAAVHKLNPAPDFILFGGDLIMDALNVTEARAREEFRLFKQVVSDHTDLPYHLCIGNHDVFGWGAEDIAPDHEAYG